MSNKWRRVIVRDHARARARECGVPERVLRRQVAALAPRLRPFVGFLGGEGRVALVRRKAPSPVVRPTRRGVEVITVLRPGQSVIRSDTMAVSI
jgi:hypothetical protein